MTTRRQASPVRWLVVLATLAAWPGAASAAPGWQRTNLPYPVVHSVSLSDDGSDTLYAAASDPETGRSAVLRSSDAGGTWTLLATALPGDTVSTIAVDPRDSSRLFAAAFRRPTGSSYSTRLYVSGDAGEIWQLGGDFPAACGGAFAFGTAGSPAVYVDLACSGELFASEDAGLTWQSRNVSLDFLRSGPNGDLFAVGFGRGVIRSVDGGFGWTVLGFPPCPHGPFITALAIDPLGRLFAGTARIRMIFIDCPGLFRSDDGGSTWTEILPMYVVDVAVDRGEPSRVYAASSSFGNGRVFASVDGGGHWGDLDLPAKASRLALSPSGRRLYAITSEGLYRLPIRKTRAVADR